MIPDYIMDLIREIAPDSEELYLSCFDEKTCIVDTTELIRELKAEIERKDEALQRIVDAFTPEVIHIGSMHNKYRAVYRADCYDPIKQARDALSEVK